MNPVTSCTPPAEGTLFTLQEKEGRGLLVTLYVRVTSIDPLGGITTDTGGVNSMLVKTEMQQHNLFS